jgi:hypothetical protein
VENKEWAAVCGAGERSGGGATLVEFICEAIGRSDASAGAKTARL